MVLVLGESELVELLLDNLKCVGGLRVRWLDNQNSVQVSLGFLIVLEGVVRFRTAEEELDLEVILLLEGLGFCLEAVNDVDGT